MYEFHNEMAATKLFFLIFFFPSEVLQTKFQYLISNYKGSEIHLAFYRRLNRDRNFQAMSITIHLYLAPGMSGLYLHSPTYLNNVRNFQAIYITIHLYPTQGMSGLYLHSPTYLNNVRNFHAMSITIHLHPAPGMSGLYLHSPTYLNNVGKDIFFTLSRIKLHRCRSNPINLQTAMLLSDLISGT